MKEATRAPFYASIYHGLASEARKLGYCLAIHGTVTADLDVIAIPWVEDAVAADTLKDALMKHIGACGYEELLRRDGLSDDHARQIASRSEYAKADHEKKPHGRLAWNLYMAGGARVDLSVMPRISP